MTLRYFFGFPPRKKKGIQGQAMFLGSVIKQHDIRAGLLRIYQQLDAKLSFISVCLCAEKFALLTTFLCLFFMRKRLPCEQNFHRSHPYNSLFPNKGYSLSACRLRALFNFRNIHNCHNSREKSSTNLQN